MTRKRVAVAGVVGFTMLAVACQKSSNPPPNGPTQGAAGPVDQEVRDYLGINGDMYKWEVDLSKAVCNLEKYAQGVPLGGARYCPGHGDWPPSGTPPPKFPPGP
jgi:hypothetical protein